MWHEKQSVIDNKNHCVRNKASVQSLVSNHPGRPRALPLLLGGSVKKSHVLPVMPPITPDGFEQQQH